MVGKRTTKKTLARAAKKARRGNGEGEREASPEGRRWDDPFGFNRQEMSRKAREAFHAGDLDTLFSSLASTFLFAPDAAPDDPVQIPRWTLEPALSLILSGTATTRTSTKGGRTATWAARSRQDAIHLMRFYAVDGRVKLGESVQKAAANVADDHEEHPVYGGDAAVVRSYYRVKRTPHLQRRCYRWSV
jgi:hypothetical protein